MLVFLCSAAIVVFCDPLSVSSLVSVLLGDGDRDALISETWFSAGDTIVDIVSFWLLDGEIPSGETTEVNEDSDLYCCSLTIGELPTGDCCGTGLSRGDEETSRSFWEGEPNFKSGLEYWTVVSDLINQI